MLFVFSRASHEKRLQNKRDRLGLLTEHKQRQSDAGRLRDSFRRAESQSSKGGRVALGVLSCFFVHQVCLLAVLLFGPDGVLRTRSARVYGGCAPAPPRLLLLLLVKKAPVPETGRNERSSDRRMHKQRCCDWNLSLGVFSYRRFRAYVV